MSEDEREMNKISLAVTHIHAMRILHTIHTSMIRTEHPSTSTSKQNRTQPSNFTLKYNKHGSII